MKTLYSVLILLCALPGIACAEVKLEETVLQKGVFSVTGCDDGKPCLCEADIKYPVIAGMDDQAAQNALNAAIRKNAEQVKCEGEISKEMSKENSFTITYGYQVTFQSPELLSLSFNEWAYEGGAHGNGVVDSMIIDLKTGRQLGVKEILDEKKLPDINQRLYAALIPNAEDIFRDEIEKRKTSFIQDGKCNGCVITLGKEGINVIFQAYEVAPFSSGNPSVTLPFSVSSNPAVKALGKE